MRTTGDRARRRWLRGSVLAGTVVGLLVLAGCGGSGLAAPAGRGSSASWSGPVLATSLAGLDGTSWAVVEMGGSAATFDNFWELFVRPAGSGWKLVTPTGVASNGGLIMAQAGSGTLVTGFRPSQRLTFSPLAASTDLGAEWSQNALVDPGLANVPDALAGDSAGRLLALTDTGTVEASSNLGTSWTTVTTLDALAAAPAARACGLTALTAVAWTAGGTPMVAGNCRTPGTTGIFTQAGGTWRAAKPTLTGAARTPTHVIALATTDGRTTAILVVGSGTGTAVIAAWSADGGAHWTESPAMPAPALAAGAQPSVSFRADGSAGLAVPAASGHEPSGSGQLATIGWQAGSWAALPALPAATAAGTGRTATLAASPAGAPEALVVSRGTLAVWQLGAAGWSLTQTVRVTIPYGSSG